MSALLLYAASTMSGNAPASISRPPGPLNQEGRILAALGQFGGALPRVAMKWLIRYHDHLSRTLVFPFEARCPEESGPVRPLTALVSVVELVPPSVITRADDVGLLCRTVRKDLAVEVPLIELEVAFEHINAQLIEDYWYWFWNWRFDPGI
jgi:hypothetical protein